jgi:hypothetical protein
MRRLLAVAALGAALAVAPVTAGNAFADDQPATVTPDACYAAGGYFGGYNSDGKAFCVDGTYDGVPFDHDPLQGFCPDGQDMAWAYLEGFVCTPDVPNS